MLLNTAIRITYTVKAGDNPSRTVKIQLSDDVAINQLSVNGTDIVAPPSAPAGSSFPGDIAGIDPTAGGNALNWPFNYQAALKAEGAPTLVAHSFVINVSELPAGGATYQIYRTLSTAGNEYVSDSILPIGGRSILANNLTPCVKMNVKKTITIKC